LRTVGRSVAPRPGDSHETGIGSGEPYRAASGSANSCDEACVNPAGQHTEHYFEGFGVGDSKALHCSLLDPEPSHFGIDFPPAAVHDNNPSAARGT
jgi:hypothetical protein